MSKVKMKKLWTELQPMYTDRIKEYTKNMVILAICLTLTLSSITLLKKLLQNMNGESQELILELKELQAIFSRI